LFSSGCCGGGAVTLEVVPSDMVCPWPFLAKMDAKLDAAAQAPDAGKSFARALSNSSEIHLSQLPPKVVMGNSVIVKISQEELENSIADCSCSLHGRLIMNKGDSPLPTQALKLKLNQLWSGLRNWELTPLGKGFFELRFGSIDEMRKVWALGVVNLKPGLLRFYCWSRAFTPQSQVQTHAQIWVRLLNLP